MPDPAWIIKRRTREALKNGRPDEAHPLLNQLVTRGDRRAFELREEVVRGYLERAERILRRDDLEGAWLDLVRVEQLAPKDGAVVHLRETLTRHGLAEIRALLETGKPLQAVQAVVRLKDRPANSLELPPLEEAAQDWVLAEEIAERGDFPLAKSASERVRNRLAGRTTGLNRFASELARRAERFRECGRTLQDALETKDWREILRLADEVLAVAPQHRETQQLRNRAWQVLQPETVVHRSPTARLGDSQSLLEGHDPRPANGDTAPTNNLVTDDEPTFPKRFFLWIDGVGGYLVCTNARIAVGQAAPEGGPVDVPLYADVSRIHASLQRDDESYVLESTREVQVNNQPAPRAVLHTGDRITLGSSCQMTFELPVPGCLSARLILSGGRRLPFAVDGVLLMADMLMLGAGEKVHVRIPELEKPVMLFRQKDRLGIRWPGEFAVQGRKCRDRELLPNAGTVSAEFFTFAIEPLGR